MQQTQWNFKLTLIIDERTHHYSFEVNNVDSGFEVSVQATAEVAAVGREPVSSKPVFDDRYTFPSKVDAMVRVRDFISGLVESSFARPSIKLVRPM